MQMQDEKMFEQIVAPSWVLREKRPVQVAPRMWVAGVVEAQSVEFLQGLGITHVLNCADYRKPVPPQVPGREYLYLQLDALDVVGYNLLGLHFHTAASFLDAAMADPAAVVLIHCVSGMNRSVAIALAYLKVRYRVPVHAGARAFVHLRPILTNPTFRQQLLALA